MLLPLATWQPVRGSVPAQPTTPAWVVLLPTTPYQSARREAGVWWSRAIQRTGDKMADAEQALYTWDPKAPFDWREMRQRLLSEDDAGYVRRAFSALQRAERLAPTPAARAKVQQERRRWEAETSRQPW
jgi:hypothetical protein